MLRRWLIFSAFTCLAFGQAQTFTYSYNGLPIPIYPDDWNVISVVRLFVPRSIQVSSVTSSVQVQFNGTGNLNVYLYSPAGTRTKLLERSCGSLQNIDTTFDDAAPTKFSDVCPAQAGQGPFRGNEPLNNSRNENGYGYWRLAVENNGNGTSGTLTSFSITITGTGVGTPTIGPNTVVSASSLKSGSVAPGDQLAILGVNLGPTAGVRADSTTTLPTTLGGTTVTFDNAAAPISYASDRVLLVQAPTALNPGSTTQVQVKTSSGSSLTVPLVVVATNPGILTYDATGLGQAKAINSDGTANGNGSINTSDRPAAPGSVISIFATGLGAVSPSISQGAPAPSSPLSTVSAPVSATIGGQPATVLFAGAAPGLTGTYQVNVMVPASARSGTARLLLMAGGNGSQDNVTVEVQ